MLKSLLIAVDGSENAVRALDFAAELAKPFGSRLIVLSVYKHHSPIESSLAMTRARPPQGTPDKALQEYATELVEVAAKHVRDLGISDVQTKVRRGPPARTIVEEAKKLGVDAIIMGSRGLGDVSSFLLGSVSHKVAGLAPCTCITVK